ncbi:hypothetical protein [Neisseria animalis]|nr:hypothetical protein [Neisseria animalis]
MQLNRLARLFERHEQFFELSVAVAISLFGLHSGAALVNRSRQSEK